VDECECECECELRKGGRRKTVDGRPRPEKAKARAPNGVGARLAATPPSSSLLEIAGSFLVKTRWTVLLQKRPYLGMAALARMACSVQPAFQGVG
jgi:hypothetical protein